MYSVTARTFQHHMYNTSLCFAYDYTRPLTASVLNNQYYTVYSYICYLLIQKQFYILMARPYMYFCTWALLMPRTKIESGHMKLAHAYNENDKAPALKKVCPHKTNNR